MKQLIHKVLSTKLSILFLFIFPLSLVKGQQLPSRPNFVIVMTDDQGYGDVGYRGNSNVQTPNLDDMSRNGLRLDRFYTAPVCSPTRAGVITGRYPTRTGVFSWGHILRPEEQSFISHLKASGYQTGFFGKWHIGSITSDHPTNPGARGFDTWCAAANFYENDPWMSKNGEPVHLKGESSEVTVDLALEYIDKAMQAESPFLVFIWLGSPHLPHQASEELKDLYADEPENLKNYYGELTGIDRAMGKLRDQLKSKGISDETLLWFSSDNGGKLPEADNGPLRDQKGSLHEGGIRVPALIEWPGKIEHRISDMPASTLDIFPTVLELAGVDLSGIKYPLDGISLVPLLHDRMARRAKPLGFWDYGEIKGKGMKSDQIIQVYQRVLSGELPADSLNEGLLNPPDMAYVGLDRYPYSGEFAWIDGEWKLYQEGEVLELYNLKSDVREEHDLADRYPDRVEKMRKALLDWQRSVIRSIRGEDYK